MDNYDQIQAMLEGTIFNLDGGTPWMRIKAGIMDLIPYVATSRYANKPIPDFLIGMHRPLQVLYTP